MPLITIFFFAAFTPLMSPLSLHELRHAATPLLRYAATAYAQRRRRFRHAIVTLFCYADDAATSLMPLTLSFHIRH